MYHDIMAFFVSSPNASSWGNVWIGGISNALATPLSAYSWMTTQTSAGDKVTTKATPVLAKGQQGTPSCLALDVMNPNGWFSSACYGVSYYPLCEYGTVPAKASIDWSVLAEVWLQVVKQQRRQLSVAPLAPVI